MPRRRRLILRVLLNPLVVILAVVAVMTAAWFLFTRGTGSMAQARPGANLLPAFGTTAEVTPAASAPARASSQVGGWTEAHGGAAEASLELADGELGGQALKLVVTDYRSGDVTLATPRVSVQPHQTYLFKAFASSDTDFTLLARRHHPDGSSTLEQLRNPLERPGNTPFTVSDAFDSGDATTAVEYVFRLASEGTLTVEGAYLEPASDVRPGSAPQAGTNLVPNPGFAGMQPDGPDSWSPYSAGALTAESGRGQDGGGSFLWTRITNYRNGEAKWQYQPVPVAQDRYFEFGASYRADREVDIVAEFELAGGGRAFHSLETVLPADEWTTVSESFQAPVGATSAMVTLVAHGDGTTSVRGYSLTDVTRPGPLRWDRPMVSITFDDGWQSVYDRALPLLDRHGFRSTQYVNASSIETPNFMTAAEVQQLHQAGHEIAAHSYEHVDLTSIGTDRLDDQVRRSSEALAAAGLDTRDLAPPYGRTDPQVDWYAGKYFDLIRGTDDGINTRQSLDPQDLKVFYVTDQTTLETLSQALAETRRMNGWLILVYHQISTPESTGTQEHTIAADRSTITSDVLAAQLQLIDDSNIDVQPVAQAYAQLQGP
ncbi:Polysaccharide deacetylase [Pseudarthrobacter enclensis]|uniref:polysaccharide deacetylase family protein n=1 Tax=Pseudarthrobacter enclensis TaxID=993070 RepID=UPI0008155D68|nr:polysaccharide deacetylase family protein [Pseudarthrobacter enclensis]SCB77429.1 Polysaccharide deacetylase [Pseudarthrobacter enclensis]